MIMSDPVVLADRGEASSTIWSAISCGSISRPVVSCIIAAADFSSTVCRSVPVAAAITSAAPPGSVHHGVSTGPGLTVLTRMPRGPYSSDSAWVRLLTPALAAP